MRVTLHKSRKANLMSKHVDRTGVLLCVQSARRVLGPAADCSKYSADIMVLSVTAFSPNICLHQGLTAENFVHSNI